MRPDEQKQKYKRRAGYGPNGPKTKAAAAKDEQIKANNAKSRGDPPQATENAAKVSDEKQMRGKKDSNKKDGSGSKGRQSALKGKAASAKDAKSKNQSGTSSKAPEEAPEQKARENKAAVAATKEGSGSESGAETETELRGGGGQFRRRKVESNWDRYKEDSEDEYDEEVIARKAAEAEELVECRGVVSEKLVSGDQMTLEEEEDERGWLVVDDVTDDDDVSEFDFVEHGSPTGPGGARPKPSSTICVKISADPAADKEMAQLTDSLMKTLDTETRRKPAEMVESLGELEFDASEEVTLDWDNVDAPQPQRVKGADSRTRPEVKEPEVKKSVEDEELDSLLALSAPVRGPKLYSDKVKVKSKPSTATTADTSTPAQDDESLESWLDSMI